MTRRLLCIIALAAFGLALASPNADAHAVLKSSDPAEGAQLDAPPAAVTITFTEAPEPALSVIRVLDASGNQHQKGDPRRMTGDPQTLRVAMEPVDEGVYTVTWRVVSKVDGHVTAGAFAFGVGVAPTNAPAPPASLGSNPPPNGLEIAGRWVLFVGLIGLVGGSWMSAAAFDGSPSAAVRRFLVVAWAGSLTGLILLAVAQFRSSGAGLSAFLGATVGRAIVWRAAGVGVAGIVLLLALLRQGRVRRAAFWVAGIAASATIYAHVAAGHAAARGTFKFGRILAQWGHFVAAGVWVGGLAALLLGIRGTPSEEKARAVRRFSLVAAYALALVAGTGVLRAVNEIDSWHGLFSSGYGRLVLIKGGLLLVLAVLGAVNRYRNVRTAAGGLDPLRRVGRAELVVAGLTLVAAAGLASISPPYDVAASTTPKRLVLTGSDFATSIRVRLEVSPGDVGANRFVVKLADYDTGEPVEASRVVLRFNYLDDPAIGESSEQATRSGAGTYVVESASNLSLQGRWRIIVLVQKATSSVEVPLEFATPCRTEAIPGGPGAPTLYNAKLSGGTVVQTYLDPGDAGLNEIHATYFDDAGNELPVSGPVTIRGSRTDGSPVNFEVRRFGAGHFVADATLEAARWRFDVAATTSAGVLRSCFEHAIVE